MMGVEAGRAGRASGHAADYSIKPGVCKAGDESGLGVGGGGGRGF
jgi:hypothetical protein